MRGQLSDLNTCPGSGRGSLQANSQKTKGKLNMKNKMKKIALLGTVALFAVAAQAQGSYQQLNATNQTLAQVLFSGKANQQQVVYLDATSDLAGSLVTFQSGTSSASVATAQTNTAATNLFVAAYGVITNGNAVVIQTQSGYLTNLTVGTVSNGTNMNFTSAIGFPLAVGDNVWLLGNTRTTPCGNTTLRIYNEAIYIADPGRPISVKVNGTSAVTLNNVIIYSGTR